MPRPTNSSSITLQLESAVVRRYVTAIRQLRHKPGIATPTVQELILRELGHRDAAGIVDDFLQSGWPAKNRRGGVRRLQNPRCAVTRKRCPDEEGFHYLPVRSKNSCDLSVIEFQEAAEALAGLDPTG
jgi:hypothetical protein